MKLRYLFLICVPLVAQPAPPAPAAADTGSGEPALSGSVEVGYRFTPNLNGNQDVYRSTVDLFEGLRLLGLDLSVREPSQKLFNRIDLHIASWGDPYDSARLDVQKTGLYQLTVDYRNIAYFNFLPSFANPLLSAGSLLTYSAFDTRIKDTDVQLDLLPGARITPYLAYSRNSWNGSGISSFEADVSQFAVPMSVNDHTDTYRGGVQIQTKKLHVTLEEGGTTFKDDQGASENQLNFGDVATFLGEPVSLLGLNELYRVRGDSAYTRASLAYAPVSWATVSGQFLYSNPNTSATYTSTAAGNLFSEDAFAFYNMGQDMATSDEQMPHTTGAFTVELRPLKKLRLVEYWSTDRLHNASDTLLIESLMSAGSPFSTTNPTADRLNLNYNEQEFDAYFDVTSWFTIRGGEKYTWGDVLVRSAALLETPFESASLSRPAGIGGVSLRVKDKLRLNADVEGGSANQTYFRTSLDNYYKVRARAEYNFLPGWRLSGDFNVLKNDNPDPAVNLSFLSHAESAALSWTPRNNQNFDVLLDYTHSHLSSDIDYLIPQTLQQANSEYLENANEATALVQLSPKAWGSVRPRLSLGGSLFTSTGSRPTNYYEPTVRLSVPFRKDLEWNSEWRYYGLSESIYQYEGFRSNQVMISLRYFR